MLAVIGEMFEEPNVVGIGMAIRSREDLLSVWNEDNSNDKVHTVQSRGSVRLAAVYTLDSSHVAKVTICRVPLVLLWFCVNVSRCSL